MKNKGKSALFWHHGLWLGLVVILSVLSFSVRAAEEAPFDLEAHHWTSFDNYKEKTKNGAVFVPEVAPAVVEPDSEPSATSQTPIVAPPSRPLVLPVLPGVNKGYDVKIDSTNDDKKAADKVINRGAKPMLQLPDIDWREATGAARRSAREKAGLDAEDERSGSEVRMSFLPSANITPIPTVENKKSHGRVAAQKEVLAKQALPKKPEDVAACAAIDAFKKKQLEEIQGDRQTLMALQSAIAKLGFQKQLNFTPEGGMVGAGGSGSSVPTFTSLPEAEPVAASAKKK